MANRLLTLAVLVLVVVNVGLFSAVLLRRGDGVSAGGSATATATRTTPSTARSSASAPTSASPRAPGEAIVLTRKDFVARPFQAVRVAGAWQADSPRVGAAVHLEVRRSTGWSRFPLPAVTGGAGRFTAFVNLGAPGSYRLRVVGDGGGPVSAPFTVTVR